MRDIVTRDLGTVDAGLNIPARTATVTGPSYFVGNYNGVAFAIITGTWTDGTHTITIQEAPDNAGSPGTWTNVAATDLVAWSSTSNTDMTPVRVGNAQPTPITSAATALSWRIGYVGGQPWVRALATVATATTGCQYDIVAILGDPRFEPAPIGA